MYKGIKFSILLFSITLLNGCATSCGSAVETNTNQETNQIIVPERADNAKIPDNSNTNMVNGLQNVNMENPTLDNSKVKVINPEKSRVETPKKKLPDNSEISVKSVGADFVETRQFLDNPQLDKVERIIRGKNTMFKVYLKDGKTFDLDEDKLKDYRKDSANTILEAVGVKPASNLPQTESKTDQK